jgi:hypothetical protein
MKRQGLANHKLLKKPLLSARNIEDLGFQANIRYLARNRPGTPRHAS